MLLIQQSWTNCSPSVKGNNPVSVCLPSCFWLCCPTSSLALETVVFTPFFEPKIREHEKWYNLYAASSKVRHAERGEMKDLLVYRKLLGGLTYCFSNYFILHLLERVFDAVNNVCYYKRKKWQFCKTVALLS